MLLRRSVPRFPVALRRRIWLAGLVLAAGVHAQADSPANVPVGPLTRVADVKTWADFAGRSLPVAMEGVVTWTGPAGNFFLHDGAMGIHVGEFEHGKRLAPGHRVRVLGATRRGTFAPSIEPQDVVVLGHGPLPAARPASYNEVASGTLDGQWLEIEGVVCSVTSEAATGSSILNLAIEGRRLRVAVNQAENLAPDAFVDAAVRVRGVASGSFNRQRQLVEPIVHVPALSAVTLLRPPPADRFAVPLVPLSRLLGFSLEAPTPHAVRIRGVVTRQASPRVLFLRDENFGLKVQTRDAAAFAPGAEIEVVGFPTMAGGSAVLESAVCRAVGARTAPVPVRPAVAALLDGSHSGDLVRVPARLVDFARAGEAVMLILQAETQLFRATLPVPAAADVLPEKGSLIEATGICVVSELNDGLTYSPRSVVLQLSDAADLRVLQPPDWWTAQRLWRALALLLLMLAAGLGWVWLLRRQVQQKRAVIEQQARHAAVLEERSRIARDLHDTLEQGLTGLSLQLKVVELDFREAPHQVGEGLEAARQMLRQSRALAHNAIRELRSDEVAQRGEPLVAGIQRLTDMWRHLGIDVVFLGVDGRHDSLPAATERHLISIVAEAITNAVKHGRASTIKVSLHFRPAAVHLCVEDNGGGFESGRLTAANPGSFGLIGMRERAEAIGGRLGIHSQPGRGSRIVVELDRADPPPPRSHRRPPQPVAEAAPFAPRP